MPICKRCGRDLPQASDSCWFCGYQLKDAAARNTDPDTSHEAAAKVDATALEAEVLDALRHLGPSTIKEVGLYLQHSAGIGIEASSPRFAPLERKGLIIKTSQKRQNPGSNRSGYIYMVAR